VKANFCYQNRYLYEHHGAWHVRYRQRTSQEDGSSKLKHTSKHLGRSKDFSNIFEVEQCRASFMQSVNRDRLSANSRITLTAFVEGAYLPWVKDERRASTSKGHHQISAAKSQFPAHNLEKVLRLRELLTEFHRHTFLKGKLVLKGGTALNLFYLNLPRLSVDIDLNYVGNIDRELTLKNRPEIVKAVEQISSGLGYKLQNRPCAARVVSQLHKSRGTIRSHPGGDQLFDARLCSPAAGTRRCGH
jgi:Nucleotidyl transferase AbiEii toxin, Type IV TA system